MSLQDLINQYMDFRARGVDEGAKAFIDIKEAIGEEIADLAIDERHSSQARARAVPRRGDGAPVLDRLYELGDGFSVRNVNGGIAVVETEFIVVEAKFGSSRRSRSGFDRRFLVEPSWNMRRLPTPDQVKQLDPDWFRARVREISSRQKTLLANGAHQPGSMADQLDRAAKEGRLQVYEVRATIEVQPGGKAVPRHALVDHSKDFSRSYRSGWRPPPGTHSIRESLALADLEAARLRLTANGKTLRSARKKLTTANARIAETERKLLESREKLAEAQRSNGAVKSAERRVKDLERSLDANRGKVAVLEAQVAKAEAAEARLAKVTELHEADALREAPLRKAEVLEKSRGLMRTQPKRRIYSKPPRPAPIPSSGNPAAKVDGPDPHAPEPPTVEPAAPKPVQSRPELKKPSTATSAIADEAKLNRSTDVANRGITRPNAAAARPAARTAAQAVKVGAKSTVREVVGYALRGGRAVWRAGKVVMRVVNLANPIMDLLLVVDAVDALVAWLQREEREAREEWFRAAEFLSRPGNHVSLSPNSSDYYSGYGKEFNAMLANQLSDPKRDGNFLHWFHKWETEKSWSGFVYGTVVVDLDRQELRHPDSDEPYPVAYWPNGRFQTFTSHAPLANRKQEGYRRSMGGEAPEAWRRHAEIDQSDLAVRYTYPVPLLSPFDFIQAKANALVGQIVAFMSKYDDNLPQDMDARTDPSGLGYVNWLADYSPSRALNHQNLMWSLDLIHWAIDHIGDFAGLQEKDSARLNLYDRYNAGYRRRVALIDRLAKPPKIPKTRAASQADIRTGVFRFVSGLLQYAVTDENPKHLSSARDRDLDGVTPDMLAKLAEEIHEDVGRVHDAIRNKATARHYNYEGPQAQATR